MVTASNALHGIYLRLRDSENQPLEKAVNILNENLSTSINFHQRVNPER